MSTGESICKWNMEIPYANQSRGGGGGGGGVGGVWWTRRGQVIRVSPPSGRCGIFRVAENFWLRPLDGGNERNFHLICIPLAPSFAYGRRTPPATAESPALSSPSFRCCHRRTLAIKLSRESHRNGNESKKNSVKLGTSLVKLGQAWLQPSRSENVDATLAKKTTEPRVAKQCFSIEMEPRKTKDDRKRYAPFNRELCPSFILHSSACNWNRWLGESNRCENTFLFYSFSFTPCCYIETEIVVSQ